MPNHLDDLRRQTYMAFRTGARLWDADVDRLLRSRGVVLSKNRLSNMGRDSDRAAPITPAELLALVGAWADEMRDGGEG